MALLAILPKTVLLLGGFGALALVAVLVALFVFREQLRAAIERIPAVDPEIEEANAQRISRNVAIALLAVLVVCGGALRLTHLDRQVFWEDETWTAMRLSGVGDPITDELFDGKTRTAADVENIIRKRTSSPIPVIATLAKYEPQWPPSFYLMLWAWSGIFGMSSAALRALAALIGLAVVPAAYWLGRELFRSRAGALIAAALVTVSPGEIVYAREARGYSLLLLCIAISTCFLLRALREPKPAWWIGYGLCAALGFYDYMLFIPVVAGQLAFVLLTQRSLSTAPARAAFATAGIAFLAYVPWLVQLVRNRSMLTVNLPDSAPHYSALFYAGKSILDVAMTYFAGTYYDLSLAPIAVVTGLVVLAFALVGLRAFPRAAVLLACIGLPGIIAQMLWDALRHKHLVLVYRYDIPLWFALQIAVAAGIAWAIVRGRSLVRNVSAVLAGAVGVAGIASAIFALDAPSFWDGWYDAPGAAIAATINALPHPVLVLDHDSDNIFVYVSELRPGVRIRFAKTGDRVVSADEKNADVVLFTAEPFAPREWNGPKLHEIYSSARETSLVVRLRQRFHNRSLAYGTDPFIGADTLWAPEVK